MQDLKPWQGVWMEQWQFISRYRLYCCGHGYATSRHSFHCTTCTTLQSPGWTVEICDSQLNKLNIWQLYYTCSSQTLLASSCIIICIRFFKCAFASLFVTITDTDKMAFSKLEYKNLCHVCLACLTIKSLKHHKAQRCPVLSKPLMPVSVFCTDF